MSQPQSPNSSISSTNDQARFLAQGFHRNYINNDDDNITMELHKNKRRRRRCIKCCGCCTATVLVSVVIMLVLGFTVFRVYEPSIRMNSVKIDGINHLIRSTPTTTLQPNVNLTVYADVSVKNRNSVSFKFNEATTSLFYDDVAVGEAVTPPGTAKPRQTLRMNVTVEIMMEKILSVPRLASDLKSGELPVSTYTRINGRINILNIIKKNVEIKMNCIMIVDLRNQYVRDIDCKRKVSL